MADGLPGHGHPDPVPSRRASSSRCTTSAVRAARCCCATPPASTAGCGTAFAGTPRAPLPRARLPRASATPPRPTTATSTGTASPTTSSPWSITSGSPDVQAVGHSKGGAALLLAELARPGTFDRLVCFEPIVFPPPGRPTDAHHRRAPTRWPRSPAPAGDLRLLRGGHRAVRRQTAARARCDPTCSTAYVRHGFRPDGDGGVTLKALREHEARTYDMGRRHGAFDRLGEVACPVVVAPAATAGTRRRLAPLIADAPPRRDAGSFPELGHFGPLEDPAAFAAVVRELIALTVAQRPSGRAAVSDPRRSLDPMALPLPIVAVPVEAVELHEVRAAVPVLRHRPPPRAAHARRGRAARWSTPRSSTSSPSPTPTGSRRSADQCVDGRARAAPRPTPSGPSLGLDRRRRGRRWSPRPARLRRQLLPPRGPPHGACPWASS